MSGDNGTLHTLPPEERMKVRAQVDHFVEVLENRYDITASEVIEAVKWVKERRDRAEKLSQAGAISLIGLIITAMAMSVVEGVKHWLSQGGK